MFSLPNIPMDYQPVNVGDQLANAFNKARFSGPMMQAELKLKEAEAKRNNALANLPFGGMQLTGSAGQVLGLEMLRQSYGENSPQYQMAKRQFDIDQDKDLSSINYQNALANNSGFRSLTPIGKSIIEEGRVRQGLAPTGTNWDAENLQPSSSPSTQTGRQPLPQSPLSLEKINKLRALEDKPPLSQEEFKLRNEGYAPAEAKDLAETYALERKKKSTDKSVRDRILFAKNIDVTLSQINPDDLVRYSGPRRQLKYVQELWNQAIGNPSQEFINNQIAVNKATMLSKQVRQFYGDSIQPSVGEKLEKLMNPATWYRDPEAAKALFYSTMDLLRAEEKTYEEGYKTTDAYRRNLAPDKNENQSQMISVKTPDGRIWNIPQDKLEAAKARGATPL